MYDFTDMKRFIISAKLGTAIHKNTPVFIPITKKPKSTADISQKRLVDTSNLMEMLDCGKHTAIEIGTLARARVCIGRKLFWNVKLIQQYIDSIAE